MSYSTVFVFVALALVATVIAAPVEETPRQEAQPVSSTAAPSSTVATETTTPMAQAAPSNHSEAMANTSFTCYGKSLGYYADISQKCKVYHFCLLGEYNGEPIYQRVSYLCMNEKVFDQLALDCVKESDLKAPCESAHQHYDQSNLMLRKAVLGSQASNETEAKGEEEHKSSTTTATTSTTQSP